MIKFLKKKMVERENIVYIIIVTVLIVSIIFVVLYKKSNSKNNNLVINKITMLQKLEKDKIGVYIDGEVNKVGYIKINKGDTMQQAINIAGGITKNADIQNIDLKRVLKNQEKIIIPAIKHEITDEDIDAVNNNIKININTANKEQLKSLEGIGDKTAENIINYRKNKKFETIDEIMEVKGIGKNKYDEIKEDICI